MSLERRKPDGSTPPDVSQATGIRRWIMLGVAGLFFVIGALGAILPGLPATPFLLLTSYFLIRTSPKLNGRLLQSRFFGPILTDWQIHGGVRRDVKFQAIVCVAIAVGATIYFSSYSAWISASVGALALVGVIVILRLPEAKPPGS